MDFKEQRSVFTYLAIMI